jgi:VanZ family protein
VRLLLAWLPAVVIAAVIWYLSSISGLAVASGTADTITRKAAHLVAYAVLALAALRGLGAHGGGRRNDDRTLVGAFVLTLLYAVSDELHQSTVPDRTGRPLDVGIDAVGAGAALIAARHSARLRRLIAA